MFEAVIFDFDSTLADTLPIHYEAYRQVFSELGIELTAKQYYNVIGGTAREMIPKFLAGKKCPISVSEIHKYKTKLFLSLIETKEIKLLETAKLLEVFYGKYKLAIASAGAGPQIHAMIDKLGIRKYFDVIVVGEDVRHGKPNPECFLLSAKLMNIDPAKCIVFGDTIADFDGARAAGMQHFNVNNAAAKPMI
jgi:HAD superfamily hydrolase (TIGR01509 family)